MHTIKKIVKQFYDREEAFKKRLIKQGASVGKNVQIVDKFKFKYEPWFANLIEIGDGVVLSAGVRLVSHDSSYSNVFDKLPGKFGKITIGNNTYVGVDTIILCGVTIGENCIIGAGSVVNKSIPSNSIAAGNPAKVLSTIEDGLKRFKKKAEENADPNVYYIDFGGAYSTIRKKYGKDTTSAIINIYNSHFFDKRKK